MPTYHHPKAGQKSRTHRGELDFSTKRGDKVYHRKHHNVKGRNAPYTAKRQGGNPALLLGMLPRLLAMGAASGSTSYGVQKLLKNVFGFGNRRKKH